MTDAQKRRIEAAGLAEDDFEKKGDSAERIRELEEENTRLNSMLDALLNGEAE